MSRLIQFTNGIQFGGTVVGAWNLGDVSHWDGALDSWLVLAPSLFHYFWPPCTRALPYCRPIVFVTAVESSLSHLLLRKTDCIHPTVQ